MQMYSQQPAGTQMISTKGNVSKEMKSAARHRATLTFKRTSVINTWLSNHYQEAGEAKATGK